MKMKTTKQKGNDKKQIVAHTSQNILHSYKMKKKKKPTLEMTKVTKYIAVICLLIPHLYLY